jgi:oligoendopeptidase F
LLPAHIKTIRIIQKNTPKCLLPLKKKSQRPFVVDNEQSLPFISCYYTAKVADLIRIVHEFSHAVQIVASRAHQNSQNTFMPPMLRECCAFLGEIALIDYFEKKNPGLFQQLKQVWFNDNLKYLLSDVKLLNIAINNNDSSYYCYYEWNYPIARLYAVMLRRQSQI